MAHHRLRRGRARAAREPAGSGRPSARAAERLEAQFAAELGLTRAAWDDALRRSDERMRQGDAAGAVASLEDQQRLLHLLEDRLHRVVSSAAVEREAERVLDDVPHAFPPQDPPRVETTPAPSCETASTSARDASLFAGLRSRAQALAGAGAAVAVTAVALALGVTLGQGAPPTPEVAAPGEVSTELADRQAFGDGGDADRLVGAAEHLAVRGVELRNRDTDWFQELRTFDLEAPAPPPTEDVPEVDEPAEEAPRDADVGEGGATAPAPAPETEEAPDAEAPAEPDRADDGPATKDTDEPAEDDEEESRTLLSDLDVEVDEDAGLRPDLGGKLPDLRGERDLDDEGPA